MPYTDSSIVGATVCNVCNVCSSLYRQGHEEADWKGTPCSINNVVCCLRVALCLAFQMCALAAA